MYLAEKKIAAVPLCLCIFFPWNQGVRVFLNTVVKKGDVCVSVCVHTTGKCEESVASVLVVIALLFIPSC